MNKKFKLNKLRTFLNITLLASSLMLLTGCEWLKEKAGGCESCGHHDHSADNGSQALLVINKETALTVESFEDFWNSYMESNPNAAILMTLYPNIRHDIFKNTLVPLKVASAWVKAEGKDKTKDYQTKLRRQCELLTDALALELLREEILKNVDKTDATLHKFYEENKNKIPGFQNPPYIKSPVSLDIEMVEFNNDKEAKEFADKAKENNDFKGLAASSNKTVKTESVSSNTQDLDPAVKMRVLEMSPNSVEKINAGKNKFFVVKAVSKKDAEYLSFDEISKQPGAKEELEQHMIQAQGGEIFNNKINELKDKYKVEENTEFFKKEVESKSSDLQEKLKEMEAAQKGVNFDDQNDAQDLEKSMSQIA